MRLSLLTCTRPNMVPTANRALSNCDRHQEMHVTPACMWSGWKESLGPLVHEPTYTGSIAL